MTGGTGRLKETIRTLMSRGHSLRGEERKPVRLDCGGKNKKEEETPVHLTSRGEKGKEKG